MIRQLAACLLAASLAVVLPASAHPATELYIPIGKSPGVSYVKTRVGRIESVAAALAGMTIAAQAGPTYVAFGKATKIYVQYADPGRTNQLGSYSDCKVGLMAEAFVADDGTVPWVKVLIP